MKTNGHNGWGWASPKSSRSFLQNSHVGTGLQAHEPFSAAFSRHISRNVDWKWSCQGSNQHTYRKTLLHVEALSATVKLTPHCKALLAYWEAPHGSPSSFHQLQEPLWAFIPFSQSWEKENYPVETLGAWNSTTDVKYSSESFNKHCFPLVVTKCWDSISSQELSLINLKIPENMWWNKYTLHLK